MAVHGAERDDARVGRREGGLVAVLAVVSCGGDEHGSLPEGVIHCRTLGGAAPGGGAEATGRGAVGCQARRVQRQVNHLGAVPGGVADTRGDRGRQVSHVSGVRVQWVGGVQDHPDGQDPGRGRDTDGPRRLAHVVAMTGDDARGGRALDRPGRSAGHLTRSGEIGSGDDGAGQVGMGCFHPAAEHGDGDSRPARDLPGLRDVQLTQPPFLSADPVGSHRRSRPGTDRRRSPRCARHRPTRAGQPQPRWRPSSPRSEPAVRRWAIEVTRRSRLLWTGTRGVLPVRGIAAPPGWLLVPHSRPVPTAFSSQYHRAMRVPAGESFRRSCAARAAAPDGSAPDGS